MFNTLIAVSITRPVDGQWETTNLNTQAELALFMEKGAQAFVEGFSLDKFEHLLKISIETESGEIIHVHYD